MKLKSLIAAVAGVLLLVAIASSPAAAARTEDNNMCSYYDLSGNTPSLPFRVDWEPWSGGRTTVGRVELGRSSWNNPGWRNWKVEYRKYGNLVARNTFDFDFTNSTAGLPSGISAKDAMAMGSNHKAWFHFYIRTSSGGWSRVQVMQCQAPSF